MNQSKSPEEWSILLNGMADEQLSEEQESRLLELLRTDDKFRREYVRFCQLQSQLSWQLSSESELPSEQISQFVPRSPARRSIVWWLPWMATALMVMFAVNWFGREESTTKPPAQLVSASGQVKLIRRGAKTVSIRPDEMRHRSEALRPGDRIQTDHRSFAIIQLADQTQLRIRPESEMVLFPEAVDGIEIPSGSISANVAPQNPRDPLTFFTPNSQVEVIGTELELLSRSEQSEVAVMDGTVRVTRRSDGATTTVSTGQFLSVTESQPLASKNWPRRPDDWHIDFENGLPHGWKGRFVQSFLPEDSKGAIGSVSLSRNQSVMIQIQSSYDPAGLFFWHDDSVLHLTFKIQPPSWFHIDLVARTYDTQQPSLTYSYVDADFWQTQVGEWRTVSIPLSEFRLQSYASTKATLGRIPVQIIFRGESESTGFLIDRIWVTREHNQPPHDARSR